MKEVIDVREWKESAKELYFSIRKVCDNMPRWFQEQVIKNNLIVGYINHNYSTIVKNACQEDFFISYFFRCVQVDIPENFDWQNYIDTIKF